MLGGHYTARELEERTGLDASQMLRIRRLLGLPEPSSEDRVFGDEEVEAAFERAGEFRASLQAAEITPPTVFDTLVKDLTSARKALSTSRLDLPDADRARAPVPH